jgi:hypothetical protein
MNKHENVTNLSFWIKLSLGCWVQKSVCEYLGQFSNVTKLSDDSNMSKIAVYNCLHL